MARQKVWVKRPGASATLVQITDDDLVDDVRDMILRKYGNSLGRNFDAPDVSIRLSHHSNGGERALCPEESIWKILQEAFPGGQTVQEALLVDVPQKRTPRPSPRVVMNTGYAYEDHQRPLESGTDYFPPMPAGSPHSTQQLLTQDTRPSYHHGGTHPAHAMSIVTTGQLPALPSPRERSKHHRPRANRQQTSSPTVIGSAGNASYSTLHHQQRPRPRHDSSSEMRQPSIAPAAPTLPTPPASEVTSNPLAPAHITTPPVDHVASPRPPGVGSKPKKSRNVDFTNPPLQQRAQEAESSMSLPFLNLGSVPPINVLIVEDNIINLKLLEAFVKRLKVRWATAMNGRDAVAKWRQGGFHLVLMDIQLPIMSGLAATKEIRRLERVNGIGVFAKSEGEEHAPNIARSKEVNGHTNGVAGDRQEAKEDDKLEVQGLFKSPVIIVALTASSLQSDRHEALAAGCNDFLTKVRV